MHDTTVALARAVRYDGMGSSPLRASQRGESVIRLMFDRRVFVIREDSLSNEVRRRGSVPLWSGYWMGLQGA